MERRVLVIGGGAAGMTAAIFAARSHASVTVLEHMDRVGKKLLSTGNGRCNFTNRDQKPEYYRCGQEGFPQKVLSQFSAEQTVAFFGELGILPKERNGCLYPNSDQASSILDVLRMELERQKADVRTGCRISRLLRCGNQFRAETNLGVFEADAVVLATGSKAAPATGSDGSGYELARRLGHRILTPLPALVQLRCGEKDYKQLAGVRAEARVDLYVEEESRKGGSADGAEGADASWRLAASDCGELQLTDYGISGIPVFQVSRYASVALHKGLRVKAVIDFLPHQTRQETEAMTAFRLEQMANETCERWMIGLFHKKLAGVLLKRAGISPGQKAGDVPAGRWKALIGQMRGFTATVTATNSFEQAQVCCGGVDTREVDPLTLASKRTAGLYLAGEILDVDGICGGYNLQWAWSSGAVAGRHAAGTGTSKAAAGRHAAGTGTSKAAADRHAAGRAGK